ncbi:MAG TPA: DUF429 domain-containing protein [Herpetosiphonaceae bacterium]|nr:DUF429 domain-containing protein [Herpetosiphonaceae bacterium]
MKVMGLDFTSAPSEHKPITSADSTLQNGVLSVQHITSIPSFESFENYLKQNGPWISGLDFPFGQPWTLLSALGLPAAWENYVRSIRELGRAGFKEEVERYRAGQPSGQKEHNRIADSLANAQSPMKFVNPPVALMFFEGASCLLESGVSVIPCRLIADENRVVVEAYPALVARRFAGSYKSDTQNKQTGEMRVARGKIVAGLESDALRAEFGFTVHLAQADKDACIDDATGDKLDAVLCAVQAGWAYTRRNRDYGVPTRRHPVVKAEGWIVDPLLVMGRSAAREMADGQLE